MPRGTQLFLRNEMRKSITPECGPAPLEWKNTYASYWACIICTVCAVWSFNLVSADSHKSQLDNIIRCKRRSLKHWNWALIGESIQKISQPTSMKLFVNRFWSGVGELNHSAEFQKEHFCLKFYDPLCQINGDWIVNWEKSTLGFLVDIWSANSISNQSNLSDQ